MTQEDKELLLKDLCARLPYHTIVSTGEEDLELVKVDILNGLVYIFSESFLEFNVFKIKPYLRPMSSMTEEEKTEYRNIAPGITWNYGIQFPTTNKIDWLNKHHFDYRTDDEGKTMIEKGLALEAPDGMYK